MNLTLSPNLRTSLLIRELRKHLRRVTTIIAGILHTEEHIVPDVAGSEHNIVMQAFMMRSTGEQVSVADLRPAQLCGVSSGLVVARFAPGASYALGHDYKQDMRTLIGC
jgi:hypothetical protein